MDVIYKLFLVGGEGFRYSQRVSAISCCRPWVLWPCTTPHYEAATERDLSGWHSWNRVTCSVAPETCPNLSASTSALRRQGCSRRPWSDPLTCGGIECASCSYS